MGFRSRIFGHMMANDSLGLSRFFADVGTNLDIYNGGGDWRYTRKGGINGGTRRVASLGAAKAVCGELARLCGTEPTAVCSADSDTESFVRAVLSENKFTERFPDFLEKMFALGGGVIKVWWDGGVKLDFITADRFVPTRWDGREISGGMMVSDICRSGKSYILAEKQEISGNSLVIENQLWNENGSRAELRELYPELSEKSVIKGLEKPLFVYFGTGRSGCGEFPPMGASVYAGAIDTLKNIDIVFDSLGREFILGKKRIIVPYYAVRGEFDENGDIRHYFDVNDEVFQAMSDTDGEQLKISDNTASLRVAEHTEALNALLDILSMQVGLSEGALSYKDGSIKTAAEVVSRNSRTYRTQSYYRSLISAGLMRLAENICVLGKMGGVLADGASEQVSVMYADGAAEDDGTRIERAVKLYKSGVISRARALSQIYGVSLETAKEMERTDFDGE